MSEVRFGGIGAEGHERNSVAVGGDRSLNPLVVASSPIVQRLSEEDAASLAELEAFIGIPVRLQVENTYGQEQYDVVFI